MSSSDEYSDDFPNEDDISQQCIEEARQRSPQETAVLAAMRARRYEQAAALVRAQPALASTTDPDTEQPLLHMAAAAGQLSLMECLVEHGASVHARDDYEPDPYALPHQGRTALLAACEAGQMAAACWLLQHGARAWEVGSVGGQPDYYSMDWGALHFSASRGNPELTRVLLWWGDDPTGINCPEDERPIDLAVARAVRCSDDRQALCRLTAHLLYWAAPDNPLDYRPDWLEQLRGMAPPPPPASTLRYAPPEMKDRCRTALLCMHRLGWHGDVMQEVAAACHLAWLRHGHDAD